MGGGWGVTTHNSNYWTIVRAGRFEGKVIRKVLVVRLDVFLKIIIGEGLNFCLFSDISRHFGTGHFPLGWGG